MDNTDNERRQQLNRIFNEGPEAELKGLRSIGLIASTLLRYLTRRGLTINDLRVLTALKNKTGIGFPYDGDKRHGK